MPRGKKTQETPAKLEQNRLMWATYGRDARIMPVSWEVKEAQFAEAVLAIVSSGASVFLRSGSGGGAVGVAIWEGDVRHPATWCYTSEDLDAWSADVLDAIADREATNG